MEHDNHWLITTALVASSIIATIANLFLLVIFCRRRGLRTIPNRFVINLLITNLLSSLLLIPLLLLDKDGFKRELILQEEIISEINNTTDLEIIETSKFIFWKNATYLRNNLCYVAQSSISFVSTLSILSILLIGVNQYFGVIHSLRYHFYINRAKSMIFIISTWFVALIFGVLSWLTETESSVWQFCLVKKITTRSPSARIFNTIYAVSYFLFIILGPFVAICVIYVCIYTAAHKNSERMRKSTSSNLDSSQYVQISIPKVQSAPDFSEYQDKNNVLRTHSERISGNKFITSLKHKLSNASVFRYREETRAAKISILVIFLVLFCYVPYGVTIVLNSDLVQIKTPKLLNVVTLVLLILSNIMSPFLFAYRNRRIKREISRLFGGSNKKPSNSLFDVVRKPASLENLPDSSMKPFLTKNYQLPQVVVTDERKSILKRVCDSSWSNCKRCNFIAVPDSCISGEARGSFSSASTQISDEA